MKLNTLICEIEKDFPVDIQEEWDNCGIQLKVKSDISKIYVALDIDEDVVSNCIKNKIDLIITHHPFLFEGLKNIDINKGKSKLVNRLIKHKINVYSMHTNYDKLKMSSDVLNSLKIKEYEGLDNIQDYGAIYHLTKSVSAVSFANQIKKLLKLSDIRIYGNIKPVTKVAVMPGSGKSFINSAVAKKCDVILTGDVDYHTGIEAKLNNIMIMDCGHYGLEKMFVNGLSSYLRKLDSSLTIIKDKPKQIYKLI